MTSAAEAESVYFVNPPSLLGFLFTAAALAAERLGVETPPELHGTWIGELGGRRVALELLAGGTYLLAGVEGRWSGRATAHPEPEEAGSARRRSEGEARATRDGRAVVGRLELDDEPLAYQLEGDHLLLTDRAGQTVRWARG